MQGCWQKLWQNIVCSCTASLLIEKSLVRKQVSRAFKWYSMGYMLLMTHVKCFMKCGDIFSELIKDADLPSSITFSSAVLDTGES